MKKHTIAVVGIGKISLDQHLPVIGKNPDFELAAVVSQRGVAVEGVPTFRTQAELFDAMPDLDAVANCVPPAARYEMVREALDAGKHVLMEKPPSPSVSEFDDLVAHAKECERALFATWHSQFNPAVDKTRDILARDGIKRLRIDWRENVRKWHPDQNWVWQPGGFGVCDPGINALSILTKIAPQPVFVDQATLHVPVNRQTPVAAEIRFKTAGTEKPDISAGFDWLEKNGEVWTFTIETGKGQQLKLEAGGSRLLIDGVVALDESMAEYEGIYKMFDELLKAGKSDTHSAPLYLMADTFLMAERLDAPAFDW